MANVVSVNVIRDGNHYTTVEVVGTLDTSDYASITILDVAALQSLDPLSGNKAKGLRFIRAGYDIIDGLEVNLVFDGTTPELIHAFTGAGHWPDYRHEGGRAPLTNTVKNGKIKLSTKGFIAGGTFTFNIKAEFSKMSS